MLKLHKGCSLRKNVPIHLNPAISKFILLFVLFCITSVVSGQRGIITGRITAQNSGETLIGAIVQIEGTKIGTVTDVDGNYILSVNPGSYNLFLYYVGYVGDTIHVDVNANSTVNGDYAMEEGQGLSLQEIVVTATAERSSDVVMAIEVKKSAFIASGITGSEIRRTPDRTVGDILKRVTGASIQDGKFAIIRGMNDRYNAGYLDGALLSSTESDRKAFAFDFVPANLIDNLSIVKSGSPELIGDFGGGVIMINTKSVPDKFTQSISLGAQYHSSTTFKEFKQSVTYPGESFNLLSHQRDIPEFDEDALKLSSGFPSKGEKERLGDISKKFNNDWSCATLKAMPNARVAYSLGMPIKLNRTSKMGLILSLNYANTRRVSENSINSFDGSGQVAGFNDIAFLRNISTGGIFNINYITRSTQVNFRNLLNINSDNNTIFRTGTGNFSDALTVQNSARLINYNRLYNGIISLKHIVGDSVLSINASWGYSNVHREVPDYRIASYTKTPDFPQYRLSLGDFFNSSTGRFASKLNEDLYSGTFEIGKKFNTGSVRNEIKAGYFYQNRSRTFYGRSFVYNGFPGEYSLDPTIDLGDENIGPDKLYLVEKSSDDISFYEGTSELTAYYIAADQNYSNKLRIVYGARLENIDLEVTNQKVGTTIASIKKMSLLPSANLTYYVSPKANIRASYFSSVNRPEFRELAPFSFFVFEKNAEIRGNADLKIADLNNFDFRLEFYPQPGQSISIGGFYKHISNPIELSLDITQPFSTFTFQNEKSANIYGLEFELKKKLDFINRAKLFRNLAVYANLSLIKSKLDFKASSLSKADRPLQGQSPYIINARLQYENVENGWSFNLGVNRVGRRIAFVGVDPKFGDTRQDIFEAPRTVVDVQIAKTIKNTNIKLTIGDLLHNDLVYYQDANQDGKFSKGLAGTDRLMYVFTNGYTTTISINHTF
ncbi:MAG TPA: TonB-dependent receptor [Saprospiraceae bacterium]|nr:TonB-dependent receptor [Saprospiraceae bacterium]